MMKSWIAALCLALMILPSAAQIRNRGGSTGTDSFGRGPEPRMPDGRSRTLMILKSEAKKSREDMEKILELAAELQEEIEANEFHTVDVRSVRKADEIIKLVRRVKSRLTRTR